MSDTESIAYRRGVRIIRCLTPAAIPTAEMSDTGTKKAPKEGTERPEYALLALMGEEYCA